jgi:hypothetical protein
MNTWSWKRMDTGEGFVITKPILMETSMNNNVLVMIM